ncbi:hypothetical protein LptCag_1941 [Leptospirillum ferriphilum]|uniref:Uncharacterized protein n=1 Tax=Leptospirillum ferriphilum TaxID=178606 RepID=A0A094YMT8_9BACT|nr:hypothetical protein LptCag_1941 [Leptospirillum ferriphilum]
MIHFPESFLFRSGFPEETAKEGVARGHSQPCLQDKKTPGRSRRLDIPLFENRSEESVINETKPLRGSMLP